MTIDLHLGDWRHALKGVTVDALITDPPYSERTHRGMRVAGHADGYKRGELDYEAWTPEIVHEFVSAWEGRVRGWICALTDHVLAPAWEQALREADRYVFAPLPCVITGSTVRTSGDGPTSDSVRLVVARPRNREFARWGALPGHYVVPAERPLLVRGGKPMLLMRAIVRDYSRPGDLVCDPCAGGATTLLAAAIEGRRAIGAEVDQGTYMAAHIRIAQGFTRDMFSRVAP